MDELKKFAKDMEKIAKELDSGAKSKKFMKNEGNKLKKAVLKEAKSKVKAHTGNYFKSIKAGKVYKDKDKGGLSIDAYSASSVAHLIEEGHIIRGKNKKDGSKGKEHGFKSGYHVFDNATKNFKGEFIDDVEKFKDKVFKDNGM